MISAAGHLAHVQDDREEQAEQEDELRRSWSGRPEPTIGTPPCGVAMRPPLTKPMNRMNRPMPTPIARLSDERDGVHDRLAEADEDEERDERCPRARSRPSRPAGVRPWPVSVNATMALMPRPAARANG